MVCRMLNLKNLRSDSGLSIRALSELSGVPKRTIEDIEVRGDCRISTAYTLCKAFGCSLDDFYTGDNQE